MRKFYKGPALFFLLVLILGSLYGCGKQSENMQNNADLVFEDVETPDYENKEKEAEMTEQNFEEVKIEESGIQGQSKDESGNDEELQKLLQSMSTRDKLNMMIIPALRKWENAGVTALNDEQYSFLQNNHFAGIILFADNIDTNEQTFRLIKSMQKANYEGGAPAQLFIACDQEGGYITRLGRGTELVGNMALCASGDLELTKEAAGIIGEELDALGFNLDFGPVVDVNSNPENSVIGVRSFSDDPKLVSENGKKYIQGLHEKGVMSCVKHFPGHGDTNKDSHSGFPRIDKDYESLKKLELIPFKECIDAGTDFIMTAHIQYPLIESGTYKSTSDGEEVYIPATLSETFLTDIIRNDMEFKGLIITDDFEMDAIAENFEPLDAAKMAINSGADILLSPVVIDSIDGIKKYDSYLDELVKMTESGEIDVNKVDQSVKRILKLKRDKGLLFEGKTVSFEVEQKDIDRVNSMVGSLEHHTKEWEIALKCVTLVKNQGVLPIASGSKVLIACPNNFLANSAVYGEKLLKRDKVITEETKITIADISEKSVQELKSMAGDADVVVALSAIGKIEGVDFSQIDTLCEAAKEAGKKSVVISCRIPYDLGRYNADALMACYNGRGMREEPTDFSKDTMQYEPNILAGIYTVFGGNKPTGKLPVRVPEIEENNTISSDILYERGFGIEY